MIVLSNWARDLMEPPFPRRPSYAPPAGKSTQASSGKFMPACDWQAAEGGVPETGVGARDCKQAGLLLLLFIVQSSEALTEGKQFLFTQLSLNTGKQYVFLQPDMFMEQFAKRNYFRARSLFRRKKCL